MASAVNPDDCDAALFDLDGVLAATRSLHAGAWKQAFDDFLRRWDLAHGTTTAPFDERADFAAHIYGRPDPDGVRTFLASRGIRVPDGAPDSPPDEDSVWGLINQRDRVLHQKLARDGVEVFPGSIAWVRQLRVAGVKTAVVSRSRNCASVLRHAGIINLFDDLVDGHVMLERGLAGKPSPDAFLEAARRLGVAPGRAVVVEDSEAGVEAGRAGGFGLVVGVDRGEDHAAELAARGAGLVVSDLGELVAAPSEPAYRAGPPEHRLLAAAMRIAAAEEDFPVDPWRLIERTSSAEYAEQTESLFALSNGYLGIRGSLEEGTPAYRPATLLNGFHETWPIVYPEAAHGFATTGQTILPVPDGTTIRLLVDDEPVDVATTEVRDFERALDMRTGVLKRKAVFELADGRRLALDTTRFVSLEHRHLACIRFAVTALDGPVRLTIASELQAPRDGSEGVVFDPRRSRELGQDALRPELERSHDLQVIRAYRTQRSGLVVAAGVDHELDVPSRSRTTLYENGVQTAFDLDLAAGQTATLTKWLAYHYDAGAPAHLADQAGLTLERARAAGYDAVLAQHAGHVADFWDRSDIVWEGGQASQVAMRFCLFTVMQASLRAEGHGVPAKGLTGTGYEGHYFWDTDTYVLPFLIHTSPAIARSLLMHRVRMLPAARRRAREVGCQGALFPWRTINGEEASAYYAAGTAQYHIDADVAYSLGQYVRVTGDTEFLFRHGVELLVETARMWAGLGFFSERRGGRFVIHKVTGPDEYSTVVDNNLFTNLMAAENLRLAVEACERVRAESPPDHRRLVEEIGLGDEEIERWRRIAERIYVPYDEATGVHPQDDRFLDQEPWDFAGTPADQYPLLLHFHPLVIYRHQVIKQADVVLATVLLPERFTAEERRRIFDYYDPLTTGDSSLSESIQAIAAVDAGKYRTAEEYFIDAASIDLADTAGNLRDGVHVASAGGSWMALVHGFAGYRWRGERPAFSPILPTRAHRLRIPLLLRGTLLDIQIEEDRVTYTVRRGGPLTAYHRGQEFTAAPDAPATFPGSYRTSDGAPTDVVA